MILHTLENQRICRVNIKLLPNFFNFFKNLVSIWKKWQEIQNFGSFLFIFGLWHSAKTFGRKNRIFGLNRIFSIRSTTTHKKDYFKLLRKTVRGFPKFHFFHILTPLWSLWSFLGGDIYPIISRGILLEKHKFQQESLSLWLQRHSSRIDRCRNRFHRTGSKWIFFFSKFYGKVSTFLKASTVYMVYIKAYYFGWFYIWFEK